MNSGFNLNRIYLIAYFSFFVDSTARNNDRLSVCLPVCPSVRPSVRLFLSVTLCILAKRYILQQMCLNKE